MTKHARLAELVARTTDDCRRTAQPDAAASRASRFSHTAAAEKRAVVHLAARTLTRSRQRRMIATWRGSAT